MKVRIRSGNQSGVVVEMSQPEAEAAISTGFAEAYVEPEVPAVVEPEVEEEPAPRRRR